MVRIRYPTSQRLIQRQCGLQEAADEHFFVQQETCLALWCGDKETLANAKRLYSSQFLKSERILRKKFVSPDFKWTIGRRLPTVLRSFLTTWFIEGNGQRTNNGIQRRTSKKRYKTLTTNVKERQGNSQSKQENLQSKQENLPSKQVRMDQVIEKEQHAIQMEQLMEQRRRQVQRMNTTRIWHQLLKIGHDKVDLERLSRQELMNILAENLVVENLTFWWKHCEQKRIQIREMSMVQLKQYLVKVGYREEWIRNQPCIIRREIVAKAKLAEEEQEEERRKQDEERWRRQEKQEQEKKEEKRRLEEKEVKEKEEREAQRRQEEVRLQREKEQEEKEYAARVLELRSQRKQRKYAEKLKEEDRKQRIEAKRNRLEEQEQAEEAARESAESFLRMEVEKLQQQFAMVMEQQKKDKEDSERRIMGIVSTSQEMLKQELERREQEKIEDQRKAEEQAMALALEKEKLEAEKIDQKKELEFYRAEIETLRMQLEQMKKDRDAAEQKNAEQLEKIRKNCQDHDDDETTRSKLSVHFETTTSEVVLQKQQLSAQDELMNKVRQGDTEQQMSDKEADENDEDVEVCVRQVMQMPQMDRRYWVKLLLPLMTQRARTVINRVTLADRDNYATVKEQLLKEFKLTPREYRSKFMDAKKTAEETYTIFTARLKNLLNYYVKSRQVNDDYGRLFDLLISDKLKESLPPGPFQCVLSKEGRECFKASMIAALAELHATNTIGMSSYRVY